MLEYEGIYRVGVMTRQQAPKHPEGRRRKTTAWEPAVYDWIEAQAKERGWSFDSWINQYVAGNESLPIVPMKDSRKKY
jgi:hypothetical protein